MSCTSASTVNVAGATKIAPFVGLTMVMLGAIVSTTVTVWLHWAKLPQASVACHVRVASKVVPQWPAVLVTVLTIVIVLLPLLSVAVGGSKVQAVPCSTVLFVLPQVMTGAVVSTTVIGRASCRERA